MSKDKEKALQERVEALAAIILRLQNENAELRAYKDDNEKTLQNYRIIAKKFSLPPIKGGRMIGDKND